MLKFSKINEIHYHYFFCESRRLRVYLGGIWSDSTIFFLLFKPRRVRVQLRFFALYMGCMWLYVDYAHCIWVCMHLMDYARTVYRLQGAEHEETLISVFNLAVSLSDYGSTNDITRGKYF